MKRLWAPVTAALLLSCVAQNDPRLKKADEQSAEIAKLQGEMKLLLQLVDSLQKDVVALQMSSEPYKSATFDPAEPGSYGRVDTTGGTFLVALKNVTPYLDGFRVTCNFGNPSSATFVGFKLKIKWGPRMGVGDKRMKWDQWQAALQAKDLALTDTLQGGAWNTVSFVISPAKSDQFGYLELSMETDTVRFR